jgi:hypothetical protein
MDRAVEVVRRNHFLTSQDTAGAGSRLMRELTQECDDAPRQTDNLRVLGLHLALDGGTDLRIAQEDRPGATDAAPYGKAI